MLSKFKNDVFLGYIFKSILSSITSFILFSLISSLIIEKLQIPITKYNYFSCVVIVISCALTSLISTSKLKNNVVMFGVLSNLLIYITIVIVLFITKNFIQFVICFALSIVVSLLVSLIANNRKKRIKI